MRFFNRKSGREQLLETVSDSLQEMSSGLTKGRLAKAGLIAGGLAGLTAGSAGVSSLRRRKEGAREGS
jgi:hypothetical protein